MKLSTRMRRIGVLTVGLILATAAVLRYSDSLTAQNRQPEAEKADGSPQHYRNPKSWNIHDYDRPRPRQITPGAESTQDKPGTPPSDAIVLFDGTSLDGWQKADGSPVGWKITDGRLTVVPDAGDIQTKQTFGDSQLHVEWMANPDITHTDQSRSNSGVFFGDLYEVQVLDNHTNPTYADGTVGALYGHYPPLVNASRPGGVWQMYDIIYRAPRFDDAGKLLRPARFTVLLNGVVVQDAAEPVGPTTWRRRPAYQPHGDLPVKLQDHGNNEMWFRNIWIRPLDPETY